MIASAISLCVRPLFMPILVWPVSWAPCPFAINALIVTRLRSRGARSGRSHQIPEQDVGRVLRHAGEHGTELISDTLCAVRFGSFVERKWARGQGTWSAPMLRAAKTSFATVTADIALAHPA